VHILYGEVAIAGTWWPSDIEITQPENGVRASAMWSQYVRKFAVTRNPSTDPLWRSVQWLKRVTVTCPLRVGLRNLAGQT